MSSGPIGSQVVEKKKKRHGNGRIQQQQGGGGGSAPSAPGERKPPSSPAPPQVQQQQVAAALFPSLEECLDDDGNYKVAIQFRRSAAAKQQGQNRPFALRGITNPANMCYLAATLQSLIHCPPIAHICFNTNELNGEEKKTAPATSMLGQWIATYLKGGIAPLAAPRLGTLDCVKLGASQRADGQTQQDAHELLVSLLSAIDDEVTEELYWHGPTAAAPSPTADQSSPKKQKQGEGEDGDNGGGGKWTVVGRGKEKLQMRAHGTQSPTAEGAEGGVNESSLLQGQILNGSLHSYVVGGKSTRKGVTSVNVEPFTVLPVHITAKPRLRIEEALCDMSTKEVISSPKETDNNMKKTTFFGAAPLVLILHLQRYMWTAEGEHVKLDNTVEFDGELSIPDDILSPALGKRKGGAPKYTLQSVISHRGQTPNTGHYVCYLPRRGGGSGKELVFDVANDTKLSTATLSEVIKDTPYLLFYQRK